MKVADIHAHIFPHKIAEKASDAIGGFYWTHSNHLASLESLLEQEQLAGISVFAASSSATTPSQVHNINTFIAQCTEMTPHLIGFGSLYPTMDGWEEELERMKRVELPAGHLSRVRDLFLFQCYTCMGFADLRDFSSSRLEEVGGRLMYSSRRNKTGCVFSFMLLRGAEEILRKYGGVLPVISAQKYNLYLKEVARMAGISRPVTSHWARHTGATLLLNAGVRLEVVARVLGHSSTEMTRKVYAKLLDDTIEREMMKAEANM